MTISFRLNVLRMFGLGQQIQGADPIGHATIRSPIMPAPNPRLESNMRFNLKVPFAEKDEAKKLGARWDAGRKIWYVEGKEDATPFSRWSPTPHDTAVADVQTQQSKVHVGSKYVEQPRVCDCPPWEVCDKCRPLSFSN